MKNVVAYVFNRGAVPLKRFKRRRAVGNSTH